MAYLKNALAVSLVVLSSAVAAAAVVGAGAVGADVVPAANDSGPPADVDVAATSENGTVTLTATDAAGDGVANLTALVDGERVGVTGSDGRVTFDASEALRDGELAVTLRGEHVRAELVYAHRNDSLVVVEETYRYDRTADESQSSS